MEKGEKVIALETKGNFKTSRFDALIIFTTEFNFFPLYKVIERQ